MSENRKVKKAEYDVVVIGGGMAGICAALASARHGARTALVHDRHVLGGNASSEIRMHICGASENLAKPELEESGILHEIMLDNKSRNDYFNYSKPHLGYGIIYRSEESATSDSVSEYRDGGLPDGRQ